MILLDTNVVSESLRHSPAVRVIEWIDAQPLETLYLSAITVAELRSGMAQLPAGKRRTGLRADLEKLVLTLFVGRVLPFDFACTQIYADFIAKSHSAGSTIATPDGYIAAIAAANGLTVATRDTRPFKAVDVPVINPWEMH